MTLDSDAAWYRENWLVVDMAVRKYMVTGEWPDIDTLQRDLDRQGTTTVDVRSVALSMPTNSALPRLDPTQVIVPLRLVVLSPDASPLLPHCEAIVRRSIEAYLSDEEKPVLRSDRIGLTDEYNPHLLHRAMKLVAENWPDPLGSRGGTADEWYCEIDTRMARRFVGVENLADYVERQEEIRREVAVQEAQYMHSMYGVPETTTSTRTVFVMMPFEAPWSPGVYDMIKRVVASDESTAGLRVFRADDIDDPGLITDQIERAIEDAAVVIADITGLNANVMYELGYAKAYQKPLVILNQNPGDSPFDVRGLRQQRYNATPTAADEQRIARCVRAALGA